VSRQTTREILTGWTDDLGSVPSVAHDFVCNYCLGPVSKFRQCFGCHSVFHKAGAPRQLRSRVVPMTSALNPSRWYSALSNYKKFQPDLKRVLASVAHHFIARNTNNVRALLGGHPDIITVVPSKRGLQFEEQPLARALRLVDPIAEKLKHTLVHVSGQSVPHQGFNADAFGPGPVRVAGKLVLLVEDSWVSGATAVSAAGTLLALGAKDVLIAPVARVITQERWPDDHPYRVDMKRPWNPDDAGAWPL
jgi:predicted amidophosphoribosyltransferase